MGDRRSGSGSRCPTTSRRSPTPTAGEFAGQLALAPDLVAHAHRQAEVDRVPRDQSLGPSPLDGLAIFPDPGGLLAWGEDAAGRPVWWQTEGRRALADDAVRPDLTVLVRYELPVTDLILAVLTGGLTLPLGAEPFRPAEPLRELPRPEGTVRLEPPPATPPAVDWARGERALGTAVPADFRALWECYGTYEFGGFLVLCGPDGFVDHAREAADALRRVLVMLEAEGEVAAPRPTPNPTTHNAPVS